MNPFKPGDVVVIEINEPECKRPPRLAVIKRSIGPVIDAEYVEGEPKLFLGSYTYAKLPPG